MKKFIVAKDVFEKLPDYCVGVVAATGFDNRSVNAAISAMLDAEVKNFAEQHKDDNIRELPNIKACRDAFQTLSMNPNKFMCSIEALTKRVQKGGALPHINSVVDLGNAFSLRYQLPMGAHDIDKAESDIEIRFSTPDDRFLPMGEAEAEIMPEGELVYVSGHTVKTRRWIWRQSEDGKITEETSHVFFPIDGFSGVSKDDVLKARDELSELLKREFRCEIVTGFVDASNNSMDI